MESAIIFQFEKATKNYWRYLEIGGGINKLYLKIGQGEPPRQITAVIDTTPL